MKKKVIFWTLMILLNVVIGVASVRTYRNIDARITGLENYQASWDQYQSHYDLGQIAELSKILGIDGQYDFNSVLIRVGDLNKFFDYKIYAKTSVTLEISAELKELSPDSPKEFVKVSKAPGVVIGHYVLMVSHANDAEIFSQQTVRMRTPYGTLGQVFQLKVLEYKIDLLMPDGSELALKELYRNKEKDFSLFEISASRKGGIKNVKTLNFPFEIGESSELRIGHFIYINGQPKINSEVARPGVVTSLVSAGFDSALGVKKNNNEFGISQSTDYGDSGSPIMAFRDGRPELIGIYLGWNYREEGDNSRNIRSRALKINVAVDEIKAKLGIDLREIQHQILNK